MSNNMVKSILNQRARGMTLIELIVAIMIIGIGVGGVMIAFTSAVRSSSDPVLQKQMMAVAEGMMEEIRRMPFAVAAPAPSAGCARTTFNDVRDYHGYATTGICDVNGTTILPGMNVQVTVADAAELTDVAAADRLKITVAVTRGSDTVSLVGWRTNFGKQQQ
jgi:MSHA pilin protein MshD